MPRFAANLTFMFTEYPFLERFEAAAEAGFEGVEVLFPYDDATSEIVRRLKRAGLPMVLINAPPPNWTGGERGFAAIPGLEGRFKMDFKRTLRFAERLQPKHIHIMAGVASGEDAHETFVRNLQWAAAQVPEQSLTIEPLNPSDVPGYFLSTFDQAAEVIASVDAPNVGLQFDTYHAQMISGDVLEAWSRCADLVRHVQIAAAPDRQAPHQGDFDLSLFYKAVDATTYNGFISGEYKPVGRTLEGLDWMRA